MADNAWLLEQLQQNGFRDAQEDGELIRVANGARNYAIYCPSERYLITIDIVQEVIALAGDTIAFASRVTPSPEAIEYGKKHGVKLLYFAALFKLLKRR